MSSPKESHWNSVKHVLRYLKQTQDHCIQYDGNILKPIIGYSDSDWASDVDDKKQKVFIFLITACADTFLSVCRLNDGIQKS
jgi:hypothetical protein